MKGKKGKLVIILLSLTLVLGLTFGMVGCARGGDGKHTVKVTLVSLVDGPTQFACKPGDPLPTVQVANKDFEGYWTDAGLETPYDGTVVPDTDITLYYRQNAQNYTLVLDYGTRGSVSFTMTVGDTVTMPATAPNGTVTAGYSDTKDGTAKYLVGQSVKLDGAVKDGTVTLYAQYEVSDIADYTIENGVLTGYTGSGTSLSLPLSATKVAENAFKDNTNITSVTIPATYTEIGKGAFAGCEALESLTIPFIGASRTDKRFLSYIFGAELYTDNEYSFAGYSFGGSIYFGDEHYESLVVPKSLKTVRVTERITDIGEGAFYMNYGLENVIFDYPDSIRSVGVSAFDSCFRLGYDSDLSISYTFDWLKNVRTIGENAFRAYTGNYESEVKSLFLYEDEDPDYVATLVDYPYPFTNMVKIPKLTAAETIGERAFYFQAAIDSIEFGNSLKTVGDYAFMYCLSAKTLHFPATLESIGVQAFFANASVLDITFDAGNTGIKIDSFAFAFCSGLSQVVFNGAEPPTLGLNVFNNELGEDSFGKDIDLFTDFSIYVPSGAEEDFRTLCVPYAQYVRTAKSQLKPAYWRNGESIGAKFEFTDGSIVYVSDPNQDFINSVDYWAFDPTYGATCGTYYPMLYEVVDDATYTKLAMSGNRVKHAKPLYANQKLIRLWHPELIDFEGSVLGDLYFLLTLEEYEENGVRYTLPVLKRTSFAQVQGEANKLGEYVIEFNRFGIPQISTVIQLSPGVFGTQPITEPAGTYYSTYTASGSVYSGSTTFYTFTYYNNKYEVIQTDVYVATQTSSLSTQVRKVDPDSAYYMIDIDMRYNEGNSITLDGTGNAYVTYDGTDYKLYVGALTEKAIGEEGYTITLYDDKACTSAHFTVTFHDMYKGSYLRATLSGADITYDFYNVYADGDWYYPREYDHITDVRYIYPKDSGSLYEDEWRYTAFTDVTIDASIYVYAVSTDGYNTFEHGYFREYDDASNLVAAGKVEKNDDGTLKFIYADGSVKVGNIKDNRGSFTIGDVEYTYYDSADDATLVFAEDFYGTLLYYYTVKIDSYGHMYYRDEHDDDICDIYIGTFDNYSSFASGSSMYYELEFHGKKIDERGNEIAGAEPITLWILYDFGTLAAWSDEQSDAQWYGVLAAVNDSRDDTVVTVYDDFGYKIYDITVDIYGTTSFVAYEYSINSRGNVTYTEKQDERVAEFVAVMGADGIAYCLAFDSTGRAIFSVRPSVTNKDIFVVMYDSGLTIPVQDTTAVVIDLTQLDTIE